MSQHLGAEKPGIPFLSALFAFSNVVMSEYGGNALIRVELDEEAFDRFAVEMALERHPEARIVSGQVRSVAVYTLGGTVLVERFGG